MTSAPTRWTSVLALALVGAANLCASDLTLDSFDDLSQWKQTARGKIEVADDNGNKAMRLTAPGTATKAWKYSHEDRYAMDRFQGISFRVKGDGSDAWDSVTISTSTAWGWKYKCYFPIKANQWQTITLAFGDFLPHPSLGNAPIGAIGALTPGAIDTITFGDHWTITHRNAAIPKFSYLVDDLQMVESAQAKPVEKHPTRAISDVIAQMKAGRPMTIFCAGDSITAGTSVADPDLNRYAVKLQTQLRKQFNNDKIDIKAIAVGGAQSYDLRTWVERDFAGQQPDLVTVLIGYNDKTSGLPPEFFRASVADYLNRVNSINAGHAAILLITTLPGQGPRFTMMDDYAQAIRSLAAERQLAFYDLAADFKAIGTTKIAGYFADTAHPNETGHALIAEKLATFFIEQK